MNMDRTGAESTKETRRLMLTLGRDILDRWFLRCAEAALRRGALRSAARHLARVRGRVRASGRSLRLLGRLLDAAGMPLASVQCHSKAVRAPGATLGAVLELGYGLMRARDFDRAERVLRRYLAARPRDRVGATLLAHVFRAQGRLASAFAILKDLRPRNVVGKYADIVPSPPKLAWNPERSWERALQKIGRSGSCWRDPARMALDPVRRDELLCAFDELLRTPGGRKPLAYGVARAIESDEDWLMPWVREVKDYLKLRVPKALPMFVARHGGPADRDLLVAGLAEGGDVRVLSAAALISLGFPEYEEVLREMRGGRSANPVAGEVWSAAYALLGA